MSADLTLEQIGARMYVAIVRNERHMFDELLAAAQRLHAGSAIPSADDVRAAREDRELASAMADEIRRAVG